MSFSRIKASGWAFGEILTSPDLNQLDLDHSQAIDGTGGGTYTLTSPLILNGDGITFGADVTVDGAFAATGAVTLDVATVTGLLTAGSVTVAGIVTANVLSAIVSISTAGSIVGSWLEGRLALQMVAGANANTTYTALSQDGVYVPAGTLTAARWYTIDDIDAPTGTTQLYVNFDLLPIQVVNPSSVVLCQIGTNGYALVCKLPTGGWQVVESHNADLDLRERIQVMTDADATFDVLNYDHFYVPTGVLTAGRTVTISDMYVQTGRRVTITTDDPTHLLTVNKPGGTFVYSLKNASTFRPSSEFVKFPTTGWDFLYQAPVP